MATQVEPARQFAAPPLAPVRIDTIPKLFFHTVDQHPRPDALMYKEQGRWVSLSTAEVETRVTRLAAALTALGLERGDRVALLSENRPEWAIGDYAVLGLGAIDVPIYPTLPANQIAYILNDCQAKLVLVSTRHQLKKILEIRGEVPSLQGVVVFDDVADADDVLRFGDLLERGREELEAGRGGDFRQQALATQRDDVATLIYTSGTTGTPKGVMLTHFNLASNVAAVHQHRVMEFRPQDVVLTFLPLSHVLERMADYYFWSCGVGIAYAESVDKVADNLVEIQPHYMVSVPRLFEKIYTRVLGATGVKRVLVMWAKRVGEEVADLRLAGRTPPRLLSLQYGLADRLVFSKLRERTGGRLRAAFSGGAPLSGDIARFFFAAGLPIYEGYGLTETSPVLTANRPGAVKLGTVGIAVPGTELRTDDNGEILARGPQVMKGYWNRPEETAEAMDADGWFHTGDVGEFDGEGFLRITDRIKNLLVTSGGKNIAPQPIENLVAMSPYISQVLMLGDKRAFPTLLVVPDWDNLTTWTREQGIEGDREQLAVDRRVHKFLEQEALSRLQGLARFEVPKRIAVIPREFSIEAGEMTPTLKVRRKVVEEHYRDVIERMYAGS